MRQRTQYAIVAAAVVAATVGYAAVTHPFARDTDTATADQQLNRAQIERITTSPHVGAVALPVERPPLLEYVQTIRTDASASEVHFQESDVFVVVCGGQNADSACDAATAPVFRDETVTGERVRVAWVNSSDAAEKATVHADTTQKDQIESFWRDVDVRLGVAPWLHTFA